MDTSLKGFSAILSKQRDDRKLSVIAYVSQSFCPSEITMYNYILAKLELLAFKWPVMGTFHNYLLGLQFQANKDNNPLASVQDSKLGT